MPHRTGLAHVNRPDSRSDNPLRLSWWAGSIGGCNTTGTSRCRYAVLVT
ncbi:MAG: hypothetical protein NVS4B9_28240 [Ktedonobacteraceae bacterium]